MSWRAKADHALRGGDNRDNWAKRSETGGDPAAKVPNVPNVPAPLAALRSWCDELNALDPCDPRPGLTMARWQTLVDASVWFVDSFGRQAAIDGWGTGDLFGILPQVPGGGGLIDRLGHHRGLVMTADEARWRYLGEVPQLYRRGSWPDLQPFWSVEL